jgi:hypothetical protein
MSYLTNNIPANADEWDALWKEIKMENDLITDRECYQFLTQMVMGICSTMSELPEADDTYEDWRTFVHLVFDEWTVYDNLLNEFND